MWVALVLMSVVVSAGGGGKPMEEDVHAQVHWVVSLISRRLGILTCQAGCGGAGYARVTAVVLAGARSGGEARGTQKGGGHGDRGFEGSGDYEWEGTRTVRVGRRPHGATDVAMQAFGVEHAAGVLVSHCMCTWRER